MISKIKKITHNLQERLNAIERIQQTTVQTQLEIKDNQQIQFDYNQISKIFTENEFIPFTSWAISPSTILHIFNDILFNRKVNIIEFGSGASTLYIAKFLKINQLDNVNFQSIESDERWLNEIEQMGERFNLKNYYNIFYAPLADVNKDYAWKDQSKWYNTETILEKLKMKVDIDLVLVDGPWGGSSSYARFSAIPFLKNHLSKNVSIYLDDTYRKEEKEILIEWEKITNLNIKLYNKYSLLTGDNNYNIEPFKPNKWRSL